MTKPQDSAVRVGQAWREGWQNIQGARVIVLTSVGPTYVCARSEISPHRRTRLKRLNLTQRFTLCGEIDMAHPEHWPAWFAEDLADD